MCISHYDYVASPEHRCHDTRPAVAGRQREWGTSSVLANWQRWAAMAVSLLGVPLHTFVGMDTEGRQFTVVFAQLWALSLQVGSLPEPSLSFCIPICAVSS